MINNRFIVKTKSKNYPIYYGNNIINKAGQLITKKISGVKKVCVIVDSKLPKDVLRKLMESLKKFDTHVYKINANEKNKNLNMVSNIITKLLKNNFNRTDCVISLGGGMIGDISALIANLTKRGLNFINIPTTLLSQVDASVGGKTGINTNQGKNLIGTFYQPNFVMSDVSILKSLPNREIVSGYGEILKHALIEDRKFFFWLTKNAKKIIHIKNNFFLTKAIVKSCKIKSKIVNKDEKEKNLRMILNFGHTFGHAFERTKNFSGKLKHGEAVLMGMMIACDLSNKKKLLSSRELSLIKKHYIDLKLLKDIRKIFKKNSINKIVHFMRKDKKNVDEKIQLILLNRIGRPTKPKEISVSAREIKNFLQSYYS
jgi:3-dehydroquinate synthase|tara:strand:- start:3176 stop:4288 length:1113 start_codon:yes stop_codon:yes gene_type:complete